MPRIGQGQRTWGNGNEYAKFLLSGIGGVLFAALPLRLSRRPRDW